MIIEKEEIQTEIIRLDFLFFYYYITIKMTVFHNEQS